MVVGITISPAHPQNIVMLKMSKKVDVTCNFHQSLSDKFQWDICLAMLNYSSFDFLIPWKISLPAPGYTLRSSRGVG